MTDRSDLKSQEILDAVYDYQNAMAQANELLGQYEQAMADAEALRQRAMAAVDMTYKTHGVMVQAVSAGELRRVMGIVTKNDPLGQGPSKPWQPSIIPVREQGKV